MRVRFCIAALIACAVSLVANALELHVSPSGGDSGTGTAEAPFNSIVRARDAIRELKKTGPLPPGGITVWVHGGSYAVDATIAFTTEDSGTIESPITYRAAEGEEVRIVGGKSIPSGAFAAVSDQAILNRIDEATRPQVLVANLKDLGITDIAAMPDHFENAPAIPELFLDDARMTLARWPNEGWAEIAKVIESGPAPWRNYQSDQLGSFEYAGDRPSRWATAPAVWLQGYWCFDWAIDSVKVGAIDTANRSITLATQHHYGIGSGNPAPRRYFAFNLLEELDAPGEYYIDRDAGLLYFWPPAPLAEQRVVLSTLTTPVLDLKDVSHVTIRGITVENCAGNAIVMGGGDSNAIAACRIRNTGLSAIVISGGTRHAVKACDIFDTGTAGIQVSGGDRKTLTPCDHVIHNNHIYNVSRRQRTHAYQLHVDGVGVRVTHNSIHDAPHQAIGVGGNDHLFEYNDIYNICMDSDDCGAFYMGRNPSHRGTMIRYNYWHDIGSKMSHGSCAIYFDDGDGGQTVYGNVFYKASGGSFGAVFNHGGHDNLVENNLFIDCKKAMGASPWPDAMWQQWLGEPLWQKDLLQDVDITKPPYIERYPELVGYMESWKQPRLNTATRNVLVRCENAVDGNWRVNESLVVRSDPGFVDMDAKNFGLKPDSLVFRALPAFKPIPFDTIGLVVDDLRTTK